MSAGAQDWRASLGGREALPGPAPPPALRRSPPARPPGPAPRLAHPYPRSPSAPPPKASAQPQEPAAPQPPDSPRGEPSSARRAAAVGRSVRARLTQRPLLPEPPTKWREAEAAGWHLPALPTSRVTRDRPPPACPPAAAARCRRGAWGALSAAPAATLAAGRA